jgi:hypothetical protein
MTVVNILVEVPDVSSPPAPPKPPAHPKFWTAHCGFFIEIEAAQVASLMEEEAKPCPH